jgi:hypothetical protein
VDSRSGLPIDSSSIAPRSIGSTRVGNIFLQAEHAQRRAALAGRIEGRLTSASLHQLFG